MCSTPNSSMNLGRAKDILDFLFSSKKPPDFETLSVSTYL